jgi:membrane protein implicated in regulation of membrane protease activity
MNWETFYLVCFLAGLMLSVVSLLGGMGHFGGHVHVHIPHAGHVHVPHGGGVAKAGTGGAEVPWWNTFSIMIFLCWFGAAGCLLTRHGSLVALVVLLLSVICGLAGGTIVFLFLTRVLLPNQHYLSADETEVVGAVGRISSPIRAGGTGEMIYEQLGARCSTPARAEDGTAIEKQEEVFVVRYEKGIAYVRRWEEGRDSF